jgi:glycosyltransferase involved in cell wall biosynthesis
MTIMRQPAENVASVRSPRQGPRARGTVTVVVPCHNYGAFLDLSVRSVLSQPDVELEVLIVDDGSTDTTAETCERLAAGDSRVRVVRHGDRHGHVTTFNEGLSAAKGDYKVLLSADDALVPGALARAARFLDDEPSVGMVYGHAVFFEQEPLPPARTGEGRRRVRAGAAWIAKRCRAGTNCISSPEVMLRASSLQQAGYFDPRLPITGDLELWLRIAAHADIGYLRGTDQGYYRRHPLSMYRSRREVLGDLEDRRSAFATFFETQRSFVPDADRHEAAFRIALANEALWKACRAYDRGRVSETPVGGLVYFAASTWPDADALPLARALRRRMRLGERASRALQPFGGYAVWRHLLGEVRSRRWARTGDL